MVVSLSKHTDLYRTANFPRIFSKFKHTHLFHLKGVIHQDLVALTNYVYKIQISGAAILQLLTDPYYTEYFHFSDLEVN